MQTKPYTAKAKPYIQPVVPYIEKAKPYAPPLAAALVVLASIPVFFTLFLLAAVTSPVCILWWRSLGAMCCRGHGADSMHGVD